MVDRPLRLLIVALAVVVPSMTGCADRTGSTVDESSVDEFLTLTAADYRRHVVEAEVLVAACMRREGFEYAPALSDAEPDASEPTEPQIPTDEFVSEFGYGISTQLGDRPYPEGGDDTATNLEAFTDEAEADAYQLALYGDPDASAEASRGPFSSFGYGGCYAEGYREAFADIREAILAVEPAIDELAQRLESDPRFLELEDEWRRCMAEAGYRFESQDEITGMLNDRLGRIVAIGDADGDPDTDDLEYRYDPAELAALQAYERELAAADYACSQPLIKRAAAIRVEIEGEFIAENRPALDNARDVLTGDR